jgi:putative peptidoglycan lipid II flippase
VSELEITGGSLMDIDSVSPEGAQAGGEAVLARRGLAYGAGTVISRLLGVAREALIARDLGTSSAASALVVSQTLPNLARTLVAEDVAQGVLVPVFSRTRDEDGALAVARLGVITSIVTTLLMICVGGAVYLLAEPVVHVLAPGISAETQKHVVAPLMRLFALMLAFSGMGAVGSAYLILRHRYFGAAVAIAASNVPTVLLLLFDAKASVRTVALSLIAGLIVQSVAQRMIGGRLTKSRTPVSAVWNLDAWRIVRNIVALSVPVTISLGMANLSGVIDIAFCSNVATGGPAAFDKAFRLALVPYGVVALAISAASINPFIATANRPDLFRLRLREAVRLQLALLIPAAAILTVYAKPAVEVIFERGSFDSGSVHLTTEAMRGMGVVLPALGLSALGTRAWTTREMPWVPARASAAGLIANLVLDAVLYKPLGLAGIALSTAIVHTAVGSILLVRAVLEKKQFTASLVPVMLWSAVVGGVACVPMLVAATAHIHTNTLVFVGLVCGGFIAAIMTSFISPVEEYRLLFNSVLRKR